MEELTFNDVTLKEWLLAKSPVFKELLDLKKKGWENPKGDEHFLSQRKRADSAAEKPKAQRFFFKMMCGIGDQMQQATGALSFPNGLPEALDLCMAPGGFAATFIKYNPMGRVTGFSLPPEIGGHPVTVRHGKENSRISVSFLDITLICPDPMDTLPTQHPGASSFIPSLPNLDGRYFDIAFADGQVLRTHKRPEHRELHEEVRLMLSQLILAMKNLKDNGTLVILLHKVDMLYTAQMIFTFSKFANIQLFKPQRAHAKRSSFYMIARNICLNSHAAKTAVAAWKDAWRKATFENTKIPITSEEVQTLLAEFGETLVEIGEPIWEIQRDALSKASFTQD